FLFLLLELLSFLLPFLFHFLYLFFSLLFHFLSLFLPLFLSLLPFFLPLLLHLFPFFLDFLLYFLLFFRRLRCEGYRRESQGRADQHGDQPKKPLAPHKSLLSLPLDAEFGFLFCCPAAGHRPKRKRR